jgi:hypothetical protein
MGLLRGISLKYCLTVITTSSILQIVRLSIPSHVR